MQPIPFTVAFDPADIDDLKRRLEATRWPEAETPDDWSQGTPLAFTQEMVEYWRTQYDFQRVPSRLNAYPNFTIELDGLPIHLLHVRSSHAHAKPLLLTHGWPGSIIEFLEVIGPLTEPEKHGGDVQDAFHVVCPALPGFGFSGKPTTPGWGVEKIGLEWGRLMAALGYRKYVAQGGDWGSMVTTQTALQDPEHCQAIHLNMVVAPPDPATMDKLSELEQQALAGMQHYQQWDSGYSKQQSTRPQTLGYALVDSAAGQAAWILEKFWAWTDCNGDPLNVLSKDELLDNVMLYWMTASGASSARIYWESFGKGGDMPTVSTPMGGSIFPKEIFRTSRRWAEQRYSNIVYWNELSQGGHFAAFEQPETYVSEVRNTFREISC